MNFLDGEILYLDKPLGWTSFDAVKRTRGAILRRLGLKKIKVGHAGTLDPLATGVMILTTGKATRRIEELQAGVKEYIATIALGATTPSFDLETEIDATFPTEHITRNLVIDVLSRFTGRIEQVPPAYSAIKIDGKRAYHLARKGKQPELKAKVLVIDEIELLEFDPTKINHSCGLQQRHLHPRPSLATSAKLLTPAVISLPSDALALVISRLICAYRSTIWLN